MPMREYECEKDGKFESYQALSKPASSRPCPKCGESSKLVEVSRPARRNPEYGIQR